MRTDLGTTPTPSKVVEYKDLSFKRIIILQMEIQHPIRSKIWMTFVLKMTIYICSRKKFKQVIPYPENTNDWISLADMF